MDGSDDFRSDLLTYLIGFALALVLSAIPFGMIVLHNSRAHVLMAVVVCGIAQVLVHFRCFLHIDLSRQKRDDLQLILFSFLIVVLMVGGTIWIMENAHAHMM